MLRLDNPCSCRVDDTGDAEDITACVERYARSYRVHLLLCSRRIGDTCLQCTRFTYANPYVVFNTISIYVRYNLYGE